MRLSVALLPLVALAMLPTTASADPTYVSSTLQGWINSEGGQFEPTPDHNMYTGNEFGMRFNSFAAFYIPEGNYSSATLTLNPQTYGEVGPSTIQFFDLNTIGLVDLLNTTQPGQSAFADLGSGVLYGSATLFDSEVTTSLTSGFLTDLNAAASASTSLGHYLVIGFTNATLNALPADSPAGGIYIDGVGRDLIPLTLTLDVAAVPEPASWAMMIVGFGAVGSALRRRPSRRKPAALCA